MAKTQQRTLLDRIRELLTELEALLNPQPQPARVPVPVPVRVRKTRR
ncbi:MAG: hypothetical protein JW910_09620 [Anaerolineae bacterium]|nr:hypothetical protein [Anaerolineae bacterium]